MRQAIEESFILDVLKNYITYNMYFKIAKSIPENPELDTVAGLRAIKNYETYGTAFNEMDKVLLQIENDYAQQDKWQNYAQHNDYNTFKLLFQKDFPDMAVKRYEQNDEFFVKMFTEPEMMQKIMETLCGVLYERLKKKKVYHDLSADELAMAAEEVKPYNKA